MTKNLIIPLEIQKRELNPAINLVIEALKKLDSFYRSKTTIVSVYKDFTKISLVFKKYSSRRTYSN